MAFIRAFGSYLPTNVVSNDEIGSQVGCDANWIMNVSGIEQRRFADTDETVADMAFQAAEDCLFTAQLPASELGMILVSSGSSDRRFPGPAAC